MKYPYLIAVLLSLSWQLIKAQLNESDTVKFQGRASLTGNYQQGNVNILTVRSRLEVSCSSLKNIVVKSQNSSLYQEFVNSKADNDIFSRNYIYYKPRRKIYPFGIAYISSNYRRKIDTRIFAGAGITFRLLNNASHVLKISTSAVYERSRFTGKMYNHPEYNGNNTIDCWRGTIYTGGWNYLVNRRFRVYYDAYWQPALNNKNNYRVQVDLGIDFPVWKVLAVSAVHSYTHENLVINGIKQRDRILTFGLTYNIRTR
jgi:hypothetical protein